MVTVVFGCSERKSFSLVCSFMFKINIFLYEKANATAIINLHSNYHVYSYPDHDNGLL